MWMFAYVSLLARLVPLLLMTSVLLAGTKWIHERLTRRSAAAANVAAAAFCLGMMAAIVPYAVRMSLIAGATWSLLHEQWATAAERLALLDRYGGSLSPLLHYGYGVALLNLGSYDVALHELEMATQSQGGTSVPLTSAHLSAASAAFYLGDEARAWQHLRHIPDASPAAGERDYLFARIFERHGRNDVAEKLFRRSLAESPSFRPALYRLLRLLSMRHDVAGARAAAAAFVRHNPAEANAPYLRDALRVIERGEVLVDYDPNRISG